MSPVKLFRAIPTMTRQDVYLNIYSMYSDNLSGICSDIVSGIYSDILSNKYSGILSNIPEKNQNERQCSLWSVSLQDGCGFFYLYVFVVGHSSLLFATFGDLKPVILHAICTTLETSTYHFACYLHHVGTSTYHFACYLHTCGPFACYLHTFGTSTCPFACYLQHFGTSTVCLGFV